MAEYFSVVFIGTVLLGIGIKTTFDELGRTDDPQYGKESTQRLLTGLTMSVWGLSLIVFAVVVKQVSG
jgi:hypothetical protein